jgi:adenine-specific DNA methylase
MMFFKKVRDEIEELRKENEAGERDKEAARLSFKRSLRRLAQQLESIPLDDGLKSIGDDLAGNPEGQ